MIMKKILASLLIALVALPWSAINVGACPMRHAAKTVETAPAMETIDPMAMEMDAMEMESMEENGHECGSMAHAEASADVPHPCSHQENKKSSTGSTGCGGDCCPVCHLIQNPPQASNDFQKTVIVFPTATVFIQEYSVVDFRTVSQNNCLPASIEYLHLKVPIPIPLRV